MPEAYFFLRICTSGIATLSKLTYDNVAIPEVHKAASDATTHTAEEQNSSKDCCIVILAIGLGSIFSYFLTKTGLTFPIYIGAMLAAALIRNIVEYSHGNATIHMGEINDLGGISLSLFLGMAMITLKLWELASLALSLIILLSSQVILIAVFTYFIEFLILFLK